MRGAIHNEEAGYRCHANQQYSGYEVPGLTDTLHITETGYFGVKLLCDIFSQEPAPSLSLSMVMMLQKGVTRQGNALFKSC